MGGGLLNVREYYGMVEGYYPYVDQDTIVGHEEGLLSIVCSLSREDLEVID
jgi:hypothetical protein